MRFTDYFREQLQHRDGMPFVEFMHHALYAPNIGYYSHAQHLFHPHGDFTTAPEITSLFGQTLANQWRPILNTLPNPSILEFGAGSGQLCVDTLSALAQHDCLPQMYFILDVSGTLKARQHALIHDKIPELAPRVQWLSSWPTTPFNGILLANEVLDAMPVHRFVSTDTDLLESMVRLTIDDQFEEYFIPCTHQKLREHVTTILPHHPKPYLSEVNLFINDWLAQCHAILNQGVVFLIDYGFPQHEYYHPDRFMGTLMCHSGQRTHAEPMANPSEHDITAHVDFTHVAEAAHEVGFEIAGYTHQASFLLGNDLLNLLNAIDDDTTRVKANQAVKHLLQPHEMGELYKVMALSKAFDAPLAGFQFYDKRASL